MVLHFNGRYRTAIECKFLEQAEDELAEFWNTCKHNSVLVFPPLGAHYRFLVHQLVGLGSRFQTVSIGKGQQRRTVVYLATGRELSEMAQSPSNTQRTFFGRGRGRRTKRPDQALYVPGALRQAKREQQEQSLNTESLTNRVENKDISTCNTSAAGTVTSAISRSTANDDSYRNKFDESSVQNCEAKTAESSQHRTPVSKRTLDILEGTGSTSSDAHEHHANAKLQCTSAKRLMNENKEANREDMVERGGKQTDREELKNEVITTIAEESTMVLVAEAPDTSNIKDERDERDIFIKRTESSAINNQNLETESGNNESDKHMVDDDNTGHLQVCTQCIVSDDRTAENCGDLNDNSVAVDETVKEQNHGVTKSDENRRTVPVLPTKEINYENHSFQDGPLLTAIKNLIVDESKLDTGNELNLTESGEIEVGHSHAISALVNIDCDGGEKDKSLNESVVILQVDLINNESGESLTTCSHCDAFDHKGEQAESKATSHENVLQSSITGNSGVTESNSDPQGLSSQPCSIQTGKLLATLGDLTTASNQHRTAETVVLHQGLAENIVKHSIVSDLTEDQMKRFKEKMIEEAGLETPQVTLTCKDAANCGNGLDVTSNILNPACSVNDGKILESQNDAFDVADSDKRTEKSEALLDIMEEKNEAILDNAEGASDLTFVEVTQNVDELQAELSKTSKKKKSKKEKSKDQMDDKIKSKEKEEKKKKKKTEKSNKEQMLDSEGKIKEGKKSKTKELSTEQQNLKDVNTCDGDSRDELSAHNKGFEGSRSKGNSDSDGDDSDNWESNFDESGDCLNPEHLEELSRLTGIANPEIHKTQFDYYSFAPKDVELDDEEFGHIVEIYNFSPDLKTQDLMQALSSFRSKGFDINWVDDTHALGIFSSHIAAQEAIRFCSTPLMKLRPVSQGIPESRRKATNCFEFLQPFKERPQTSKLLADRMVTGALGIRSKMTREERVKEREKLKEAKNKKQQEKIQKAQIWGD